MLSRLGRHILGTEACHGLWGAVGLSQFNAAWQPAAAASAVGQTRCMSYAPFKRVRALSVSAGVCALDVTHQALGQGQPVRETPHQLDHSTTCTWHHVSPQPVNCCNYLGIPNTQDRERCAEDDHQGQDQEASKPAASSHTRRAVLALWHSLRSA